LTIHFALYRFDKIFFILLNHSCYALPVR